MLLMDEPFGALDAMTRDILHDEEARTCGAPATSVLFVTHNVREAAASATASSCSAAAPEASAATVDMTSPRPRRIDSAAVNEVAASVTDRLREEVRRHAADDRG